MVMLLPFGSGWKKRAASAAPRNGAFVPRPYFQYMVLWRYQQTRLKVSRTAQIYYFVAGQASRGMNYSEPTKLTTPEGIALKPVVAYTFGTKKLSL
jgi:hypothetical protein